MTKKANTKSASTATATVEQFSDSVYQVTKGKKVFQVQRRTSKMWDVFDGDKYVGSVQGLKKAIASL